VGSSAETAGLLAADVAAILDNAADALRRTHSSHYESVGEVEVRQRLEALFDRLVQALARRDVGPLVVYAQDVAEQRFRSGFDLSEVQSAFNALEEAVWARVLAELPPDELAEALGLVSTALGAGKDALARRYVSLAAQTHAPSLDLSALFTGIES
jgi:hypothetical protein